MSEVTIIGVGLAKRVFQLHGAYNDGIVAFRKKLSRGQFLAFVAQQAGSVPTLDEIGRARSPRRSAARGRW